MATVTIVGAGVMGSAMAFPARENGHEVRLVGTPLDREIIDTCLKTNRHPKYDIDFPKGVSFHQIEDVEEALKGADVVVCGVSSFGVDWFGENIIPLIKEEQPVLSITKGLIDTPEGKLMTFPEYWSKLTDKQLSINAIGGPCICFDMTWHDDTVVSFCGEDMKILTRLKEIFRRDYYHISLTTDITGIETAVALKNGFALAVATTIGLLDRRTNGDTKPRLNCEAGAFGQALKEATNVLRFQNADRLENQVVFAGDLYVTVYGGRSRRIGVLLGKGLNIDEAKAALNGVTLESLVIIERVARAIRHNVEKGTLDPKDFPLLLHMYDVIVDKKEVVIPWEDFTYED